MSRDLNQVTLIGRLTRDPEIHYNAAGTAVTKISIANNNSYIKNNEVVASVNYFDINVWGNQAISCEKYLKKGSQIGITGSLKQNRWQDKDTQKARSKVEITAISIQFLSKVDTDGIKPVESPAPSTPPDSISDLAQVENNDDSPF